MMWKGVIAALHIPRITSPVVAVQAAIVAEHRARRMT